MPMPSERRRENWPPHPSRPSAGGCSEGRVSTDPRKTKAARTPRGDGVGKNAPRQDLTPPADGRARKLPPPPAFARTLAQTTREGSSCGRSRAACRIDWRSASRAPHGAQSCECASDEGRGLRLPNKLPTRRQIARKRARRKLPPPRGSRARWPKPRGRVLPAAAPAPLANRLEVSQQSAAGRAILRVGENEGARFALQISFQLVLKLHAAGGKRSSASRALCPKCGGLPATRAPSESTGGQP